MKKHTIAAALAGLVLAVVIYRGNAMKTAIEFLKREEGFRAKPYKDTGGKLTIGYGHLIKPGEKFTELSQAAAAQLLEQDLKEAAAAVAKSVRATISEAQRAALISFTFNLGGSALAGSTLLRKLNAGDYRGAAAEFPKWINVRKNGVLTAEPGLIARRARERAMFEGRAV